MEKLETQIPAILKDCYDLTVIAVKAMDGYESSNFRIKTADAYYVLKVYDDNQVNSWAVEGENAMLRHLNQSIPDYFPIPIAVSDLDENPSDTVVRDGKLFRLLSFLEGDFMGDQPLTETALFEIGRFLAMMDKQLEAFQHPVIAARRTSWDLHFFEQNLCHLSEITAAEDQKLIQYFALQFREQVLPKRDSLRRQVIHNDANDWNILLRGNEVSGVEVSGIIDFGDAVETELINELAIALAYALMDKEEPLKAAGSIIAGYHSIVELEEVELEVLYYLVAARLCTSVLNSAVARKENPDNAYISVSEKPAWALLRKWLSINPILAANSFRMAAGFEPRLPDLAESIAEQRQQHLSPILSLSYQRPIHMHSAAFQYMFAGDGTTFLDAYNNIPHVGHSHPKVVEAGQRQMARLNTNTRYLYRALGAYAEHLLDKFPASLNKVYFVNSGSAASDLALRLARNFTGRQKSLVLEHGYHGNTRLGVDVSHYKFDNAGGRGAANFIKSCPLPDAYRGEHGADGAAYAADVIDLLQENSWNPGAFIAEPIVGCGGQVPLAPNYLATLYPALREAGCLCISDEVQTGFGRLGETFWGFEQQAVVPDIVVLGKPIANGHPMAAVVTRAEIADSFHNGMEFFSSFGGNPVSCEIATAVLATIEEEQLQENALETGNHFLALLNELKMKHLAIGDVRGSGLFLGVDMVQNAAAGNHANEGKTEDPQLAKFLKDGLRDRNILVSTDGPKDSVIKMKPPLCFNKENATQVAAEMDALLTTYTS